MFHSTASASLSQKEIELAILRTRTHDWLVPMIDACNFEEVMTPELLAQLVWMPATSTSTSLPAGAAVFIHELMRLRPNVVELSRISKRTVVGCRTLRGGHHGITTLTVLRQQGYSSEFYHPVLIIVPGSLGGPRLVYELYIGDPNTPPTAL